MRRCLRGGIALALLLGLAWPVLAGDKDGAADTGSSWLPSWLGGKKKPQPKKDPAMQVTERPITVSPADLAASVREQELNAFHRRHEALLEMEKYAILAGDEEQVRRIHQLQERTMTIYRKRTAHLPGRPPNSDLDETVLEQKLGTTRRAEPLTGESGSDQDGRTANLGGAKR